MINTNTSGNLFSGFVADYDRMIDWEKRLSREAPFFKRLFMEKMPGKVLDTACATGRHAVMFSSWGLQVAASDASSEMIDRARANALKIGSDIEFQVAGLTEIHRVYAHRRFDFITCMGNSLPHLKTPEDLEAAFRAVNGLLEDNGQYILQIRNYPRIYSANERFMPLNSYQREGKEYLYLRMNDLGPEFVTFNILILSRDEAGKWAYRVESEKLKPWTHQDIVTGLGNAGLKASGVYGDMFFKPYDREDSQDLVIIAEKA